MFSTRYQFKAAIIRYENVLISSSECCISRQTPTQDFSLVEVLKLRLMIISRHRDVDHNLTAPLCLTLLRGLEGNYDIKIIRFLTNLFTFTVTEISLSLITESPMGALALTNNSLFFR